MEYSIYNLSQLSKRNGTRQDIAPSSRRRIQGNSTVQTEWQKTRHENGHSLINAPAAFLIRSGKPPARKKQMYLINIKLLTKNNSKQINAVSITETSKYAMNPFKRSCRPKKNHQTRSY